MSNPQTWNFPAIPAGLTASVDIGWPTLASAGLPITKPVDVQIGRVTLPQIYSVTVGPDPFDERDPRSNWVLVLQFMIDEGAESARLQSALAGRDHVDIALKRVKDLWSIQDLQQWAESQIIAERYSDRDLSSDEVSTAFAEFTQILRPRTRRIRTTITQRHLEEVADVYAKEARKPGGKPTSAVQAQFNTSHSNAARWVSLARKRGLLEPAKDSRGGHSAE